VCIDPYNFQLNFAKRTQLNATHAIERGMAFSEIRLFLENFRNLEFHEIWHDNTLGVSNRSVKIIDLYQRKF